jgi:hypothetical protein
MCMYVVVPAKTTSSPLSPPPTPNPEFPDDLWDRLLPHAELTLNVMRPWRPDPSLSVGRS